MTIAGGLTPVLFAGSIVSWMLGALDNVFGVPGRVFRWAATALHVAAYAGAGVAIVALVVSVHAGLVVRRLRRGGPPAELAYRGPHGGEQIRRPDGCAPARECGGPGMHPGGGGTRRQR